ncbi:MAG: 3'-5' exoribonuclease [Bacteroidota bacterium]
MSNILFLDTEFTGLHQQSSLISLALVADDDTSFYAEFTDFDKKQVNEWIEQNVIQHLFLENGQRKEEDKNWQISGNRLEISQALRRFLSQYNWVHIWADCLAYDWVLFCNLFGGAMNLPNNIFYMPFDLVTLLKINNIDPDIDREKLVHESLKVIPLTQTKHNALWDAHIIKLCYEKVIER